MSDTTIPAGFPEPIDEPSDDEIEAAQKARRTIPEAWEDGVAREHDHEEG